MSNPLRRVLEVTSSTLKPFYKGWFIRLERPIPQEDLTLSREQASIPSFSFFLLLALSVAIATLGLLANSAAVIIGAMIVAPLMNPILSMAYGITTGNWMIYQRSILTLGLGIGLT